MLFLPLDTDSEMWQLHWGALCPSPITYVGCLDERVEEGAGQVGRWYRAHQTCPEPQKQAPASHEKIGVVVHACSSSSQRKEEHQEKVPTILSYTLRFVASLGYNESLSRNTF